MAGYLVEAYHPRPSGACLTYAALRAQAAAEALAREGAAIRFVRAIAIPDEDTCFFLYEATTAASVGEASRRASIRFDRIVDAEHAGPISNGRST
jgi:hypothetical protein